MKVILMQELQGRGGEGDVIDVALGYAVNYLLPRGIAIEATKGNLKQLEQRRHNIEKRELARTTDAEAIKAAIDGKTVKAVVRAGEEGQLFGSVTNAQVADLIAEQLGPVIDRKRIVIRKPIKMVGMHEVTVDIYRETKAVVNVEVVDENAAPVEEEAAAEETAEVVEEVVEVVEETVEAAEAVAEEVAAE